MKDRYLITVKGTIRYDDDEEFEELTTTADYAERDNKRLIKYREIAANEDNTSYVVTNIIKIEDERITLTKRFENRSGQMIFESGVRHQCIYIHEFGPLSIGLYTDSIFEDISEDGGTIDIRYTIDYNGGFDTENTIHITLKKMEEENNVTDSDKGCPKP